jgi:hypothetical protein
MYEVFLVARMAGSAPEKQNGSPKAAVLFNQPRQASRLSISLASFF